MSEATPGPWLYLDIGTVETDAGEVIAECVDEKNGELIAAAPDLLAAAKRALNILKAQGEAVRPKNVLGALDAAIRKAESRQ